MRRAGRDRAIGTGGGSDGERHQRREGCGDVLAAVHGHLQRAGVARGVTAPAVENLSGISHGREGHHIARRIGGLIGRLGYGAARGGDIEGVGTNEIGRDVFGGAHRHRQRIGGAAGVAAPPGELMQGIRRGGQCHHGARRVARLIGGLGHGTTGSVDGERKPNCEIGREGAVHVRCKRVAGRVAHHRAVVRPAHENAACGGCRGDGDVRTVVI